MALSNGMKLALDWLGLASDLLGLARIDQVLEIGELILDRKFDLGLASDWHPIGTALARIDKERIRLILDCAKDWAWIGVQFALSGDRVT